MSVQKKSLLSNRDAVKKARIASQAANVVVGSPLDANSLTAQAMKRSKPPLTHNAFRMVAYKKK